MEGTTFLAKVMKPARVTIPEAVVDLLDIKAGDLVEVTIVKKVKQT